MEDGGTISLAEISHNHNDFEGGPIALNKVMKDIFTSCDPENCGFALVSELIEFISPFLQENKDALNELKIALDPNDRNPPIDSGKFYRAMSDWANRLSHGEADNNIDFHNVTPRDLENIDNKDLPFAQSTPRSSFGHHLLKGYVESGILNFSNTSSYSYTPNNATGGTDRVFLEDQINELEHQKRRLTEELLRVRQELSSCVDQNEALQSDLDRLSTRLANEKKVIEQLVNERRNDDDSREALSLAQKQINKLEKNVASSEKFNNSLKQQLDDLSTQKLNVESKLAYLTKTNEDYKATIIALQTTADDKEREITSLEELNCILQEKIKDQQEIIEQCNAVNDRLKVENKLLEKFLRDRVSKNDSFLSQGKSIPSRSTSLSNYESTENKSPSPNRSDCLLDSSEDDVFSKYITLSHMQSQSSPCDSLQTEIAQVAADNHIEQECDHNIKLIESEHKILNLQCELMQHQNCRFIIEKHQEDIKNLKQQITEYQDKLKVLSAEVTDLKTQISLSENKELLLHEKCNNLDYQLMNSKTFVTEIRVRLNECTELEAKCNVLQSKVDSLESENSQKYIKIVELTMELDSLLHENKEKNDLSSRLLLAEEDKAILARERNELVSKLTSIEEANLDLKSKMETLQSKNETLENEVESVKKLKHEVESEKQHLQSQLFSFDIERQTFLEKVKQLECEKKDLNEIIDFEKDKLDKKIQELIDADESGRDFKRKYEEALSLRENHDKKYRCLEENIESQKKAIEELKNHSSELLNQKTLTDQINATLKDENEDLHRDFNELMEKLELSNANLASTTGDLQKEKAELLSKLEKNELNLNKRDIESKKLSLELVALKITHGNQEKLVDVLKNEKSELQEVISSNEERISGMLEGRRELVGSIEDLNAEIDRIKVILTEQLNLNGTLQVQIEEKEVELTRCRADLGKKEELVVNLKKDIAFYENDIKGAKSLCNELQKKYDDNTHDTKNLKEKCEYLKHEHEMLKMNLEHAETSKTKLESDLAEEIENKNAMDTKLSCLENKYQTLVVDHEQLKQNFHDLQIVLGTSKLEIENLSDQKSEMAEALKRFEEENKEIGKRLEDLMLEKESWLTEKVELSRATTESCANCTALEMKLRRKTGFDQLAIKSHKLEQKVAQLEDQLLKEKSQNVEALRETVKEKEQLERENIAVCSEKLETHKMLADALKEKMLVESERISLLEEVDVLRLKLRASFDNCSKLLGNEALSEEEDFGEVTHNLREARSILSRSTLEVADCWKISTTLQSFEETAPAWTKKGPLFDEVFQMKHQVHDTTILLNVFIAMKNCDANAHLLRPSDADSQRITESSCSKPLKKFTLKPATLIVRPASPDSPSMNVLCQKFAFTPNLLADPNNSPDSAGDDVPAPSGIIHSTEENLEISGHDVTEYFEGDQDVYISDLTTYEDALDQEASPNLNCAVLEDLGLCGDNVRLSEKETEEKFIAIVLGFTIDNASVVNRYQMQKSKLLDRENDLAAALADLVTLMSCYLTENQLADVSPRIDGILNICTQVSISAVQFGALRHENHLVRAISVLINYVAMLQRKLESNQSRHTTALQLCKKSKSTGSSTKAGKSPSDRRANVVALKEDVNIVSRSPTSLPQRKKFRTLKTIGLLTLLLWMAFAVYSTFLVDKTCCTEAREKQLKYPWSWISWEEMFAPFVKIEYRDGPPPT